MTGWEALRALKDDPALRRIPVVIVSALAREGERATLLGAADVLNKPVGAEELARVLQRTLDRARPPALVLVEEDPGLAVAAGGFLERAGFQVLRRAGVLEAENRLSEAVLDGFVLCLGPDAEEAAGFLARLRRRPDVGGLPVLVCGASPVNGEEADRLRPFASALVPAGERLEAELGRALARIFPISPTG
jgi:DNA-binding response OmpR family regulator